MAAVIQRVRDDSRLRGALGAIVTIVVLLAFTQLVLPGAANSGARGTPLAIVFRGFVYGLSISLSAVGLVLVYRSLRVVNFSQTVMGAVGTLLTFQLLEYTRVPFPIAFVLGVLTAAFMGAITGIVLLRFFNSSRLFLTVVTILGAAAYGSAINFVLRLPFFPPLSQRSGDIPVAAKLLPFAGFHFTVGTLAVRFGFGEVFAIEVAILTLLAVGAFFRYSRAGVAVRALSENAERATLLGIGVSGLSVLVWTLAGALDGVSTTLAASIDVPGLAGAGALLPPLAAAVIARMQNLLTTVVASVVIGTSYVAVRYSYPEQIGLYYVGLFVVVAATLVLQRRRIGRSETGAGVSWSATDEPRPIPKELASIAGVRLARYGLRVAVVVAVIVYPFLVPTSRILLGGVVCISAIATLSLVVLTGWAGQVSLGQFAFVGIGSVVGGAMTNTVGIPFWFALPLGALVTAALSVIVGLPALRIRGLFLLVTTLGFAVVVQVTLFDKRYFGWLLPKNVDRPTLFLLDFQDEKSMYFLCVACLALAVLVVNNLRRSRVGRSLIALRENEANVQAFGLSPTRLKMLAFAISGGLCGFAGVLYAHQQRGVAGASFSAQASVLIFVDAVVGGVSSPGGALLGSLYRQLTGNFLGSNVIVQAFAQSGGPLAILFLAPGGLISLVNKARDSVLRIVAQRRRLVVPSLFADYDPKLLERQLIPLADADLTSGLAAVPLDERFALPSELYAGSGTRFMDALGPADIDDDTAALSAAARNALELELAPAAAITEDA